MWSLHDDELPRGAVERLGDEAFDADESFDAAWELEALLDTHARHGEVDAGEVRRLVAALDLAHDGLADGDRSAVRYVESVIERVEALVADGRFPAHEADEVIALAHAAIDMAGLESLPDHQE